MSDIPFELESLSKAVNYQRWVYETVAPFVGKRVLEIGAGIGNMSKWMHTSERLILTEGDPVLVPILDRSMKELAATTTLGSVDVRTVDVLKDNLDSLISENLDTVISFNVLEHIEDDATAIQKLCEILKMSKATGPRRLVTFVPAHAWAYGSMDKTFGHYRRYSKKSLISICQKADPSARLTVRHFNAFGLAGWYLNGLILKKQSIGAGSIQAFETLCPVLAPIDTFLHRVLRLPLGQSLLAVMEWPG